MNDAITISVVTPCYNGARFVRDTIESVLAQTYPPLEMIVVDDGSTDDSAAIAESFGSPVRVIRQKNQGESVARNVAIREARGDYIALLDADDLVHPESYARLVAALQEAPGGVAHMGCVNFRESPDNIIKTTMPRETAWMPGIFRANFGPPHTWLAPKRVIVEAGLYCEPLTYFEDWDLWWRVAMTGAPLVTIDFAGALYRQHAASQLAVAKEADRALGYAQVVERMGRAVLAREDVFAAHGEIVFWVCWSALQNARRAGVAWNQLAPLVRLIEDIVSRRSKSIDRLRFARMIRWMGVRGAGALRGWLDRSSSRKAELPS